MSLFTINQEKCKRDGICAKDCPAQVIVWKNKDDFPMPAKDAEEFCINCGHCVAVCPYEACRLQRTGNRSVSRVIKIRCKACGSCVSVCPNGAMQMPEQNYRVTGEMIRRAFREVR